MALAVGASGGALPWSSVAWPAACSLAGHLVLYSRIRAGVEASFPRRAPGDRIAFAHSLLGFGLLGLACVLHALMHGVALQLMFVVIAFDIHRLSRRQLFAVAIVGFATAALALLADAAPVRLIDVATGGGCLAALIAVGQRTRSIQSRQQHQRTALSAALTQWRTLSRHDALTSALSRRYGSELLQQEAVRQKRDRQPFSVGLLDVDHFKRINDVYGHALGDEVLIDLVRLTGESLGEPNRVVRWGGEEFLLLLPATTGVDAAFRLSDVRERIVAHDWARHAKGLVVDVSIGVTEHCPGDTIEASVARADAALYGAKAEGRGRVVQDRR